MTEKRKYTLINSILIAVFAAVYIKAISDSGFISDLFSSEIDAAAKLTSCAAAAVLFLLFAGLFAFISFVFRKFKIYTGYMVFAVLSGLFIISAPFHNTSRSWIAWQWYYLFELKAGMFIVFLFPAILVISLLSRFLLKKFSSHD